MERDSNAKAYLSACNSRIRRLGTGAHSILTGVGCEAYVKTIYIGYEIEGTMVAALYAHRDCLEVALALPEDADHPLLVDAGHLTWRTLPLAAVIREEADLPELSGLAELAASRVRSEEHDVVKDNEYFIKSRQDRN